PRRDGTPGRDVGDDTLRREPGGRRCSENRGAAVRVSWSPMAAHRPAADQQGEARATILFSDRKPGPGAPGRASGGIARVGGEGLSGPPGGESGRRGDQVGSRTRASRSPGREGARLPPPRCPGSHGRAPAVGRARRRPSLFQTVERNPRPARRPFREAISRALHGNDPRLRGRRRRRRDAGPRRDGPLRIPRPGVNVGNAFAAAVLDVILAILSVIQWLVIIAAVISWVNPDPRNPIVQFLYRSTEPILRPFR